MQLKRLMQSGSASEAVCCEIQKKKEKLTTSLNYHKAKAQHSHVAYNDAIKRCQETWTKMLELEQMPDSDSNEELLRFKEQFVLVLCADYQQSKLIPYWGSSPQPGMTYYLQKMSYDIFGIIDCRDLKGYVYLAPETIDPKNTDHTMSYLTHFLTESGTIPSWLKRIHVFLDNAGSSNKNYYMAGF